MEAKLHTLCVMYNTKRPCSTCPKSQLKMISDLKYNQQHRNHFVNSLYYKCWCSVGG